jgi:hypothetical protein
MVKLAQKRSNPYAPSQGDAICGERIRQARWAFNLAAGFVALCSGISLVGFILFLAGQTSKGAYMAAGGLTSTAVGGCCIRFARDANDRLDKLAARELENQSRNPSDNIDNSKNHYLQDMESSNLEDTDSNDLANALEKLEQAILLDVQRDHL